MSWLITITFNLVVDIRF